MTFGEHSVVGRLESKQFTVVSLIASKSLEQKVDLEVLEVEADIEREVVLRKRTVAKRSHVLLIDDTVTVQILVLDVTKPRSAE